MRRAHWSARPHSARAARIAIPLALALVVGLVLGLKLIGSGHTSFGLSASGTGACATPSAAESTASVTPSPTVSASSAVAAGTTQAESASLLSARGPRGRRHHFVPTPTASATATTATAAPTASVTASATPCPTSTASASASASPTATAPVAVANVNCDIVVPADPLSATGLATPWQLTGPNGETPAASGCNMTNAANLGAFVQATILDPATGALSVYEPLVITQGTTPAVAPAVPTLPANAVVTIDVGFNGTDLTQVGATPTALQEGNCVNGLGAGSDFGQVSFCNGSQFFAATAQAEAAGLLTVPASGTASNGQACPTVRNFNMIDQDQSDNVTSIYLLNANGQTAQNNAANVAALAGATKLVNGSDNALISDFLDPTLGCTSFEAPDLSQAGAMGTSQALNELSAQKNQTAPIALVPENDEMTLVNGAFSVAKTNLYRAQVGQDPISAANDAADSPANYCQNMVNVQTPFLSTNQALLATDTSPVAAVGNNLFTFMANRLSMSFVNLNCGNFGLQNPVTVTLDGNGVATAATFNLTPQTATTTTATPAPTASPTTPVASASPTATAPAPTRHRIGRRGHLFQNPSGM
jgi:hypothetical protein